MTQIPRRFGLALFAVSAGAPVLLGLRGFRLLSEVGGDGREVRLAAESFFFLAVVATVAVAGMFVLTMLHGRRVERELDKIVQMTRHSGFSPSENLRRLGGIGDRIAELYTHLDDLNERRAARISSLAAAVDYLLANTDHPLVIIDTAGTITHASRRFAERLGQSDQPTVGRKVAEVFPDLEYRSQLLRLERSRAPVETGHGSRHLWLFPVFNKNGDLAAVIADQAGEITVSEAARVDGPAAQSRRRGGILQRTLFSKLGQRR
jgi:PAS domain S-box-containing protein